ncbi:hypothetical protein P0F65_19020 [Sphingomonas sp. I4]
MLEDGHLDQRIATLAETQVEAAGDRDAEDDEQGERESRQPQGGKGE